MNTFQSPKPTRSALLAEVAIQVHYRGVPWLQSVMRPTGKARTADLTDKQLALIVHHWGHVPGRRGVFTI